MGFGSKIQAGGPQLIIFLDTTKIIVKTLGEKYEEEHVGPHLFGDLIEPFPVCPMVSRGQNRFIAAYLGHDTWFQWSAGIPYMDSS